MIEHTNIKLRQLLESDSRIRALERRWKASGAPKHLVDYLHVLLRAKPRDIHEVAIENGRRVLRIDYIENRIYYEVFPYPTAMGSNPDYDFAIKTAVSALYRNQRTEEIWDT